MAFSLNMDLVQVNEQNGVITCKIMNYGKFIYDKNKKAKNSNSVKKDLKEIKFRPSTDIGDINTKVNKVNSFLDSKHDVKLVVQFKGREQAHLSLGYDVIKTVLEKISSKYKIKQPVELQGRYISTIIESV